MGCEDTEMVLYLFHSALVDDVVAFTPAPVADQLPHGKEKGTWCLEKQLTINDTLPTTVPWGIIVEQVSRYGYCLVQGTPAADHGASSPG